MEKQLKMHKVTINLISTAYEKLIIMRTSSEIKTEIADKYEAILNELVSEAQKENTNFHAIMEMGEKMQFIIENTLNTK